MYALAHNEQIFTVAGETITFNTFFDALKEVGIEEGDTIFVQSDLIGFGELVLNDYQRALSLITKALQLAVGEKGTVVMPAFTYSFLSESWSGPLEDFDVKRSPSKTGVLTEFFRKQSGVIRTVHPTHSVAIWGEDTSYLCAIDRSTFGSDSIFGKLYSRNAKVVCMGFPLPGTFIHFIEVQCNVPYRSAEKISGRIIQNEQATLQEFIFHAKRKGYNDHFKAFIDYLISHPKVKRAPLGYGFISVAEAHMLYDEGVNLLNKDVYALVRKEKITDRLILQAKRSAKSFLMASS